MQPHQERVVAEQAELRTKLSNLRTFLGGTQFNLLDDAEKDRLYRQESHMTAYIGVLDERIAAF